MIFPWYYQEVTGLAPPFPVKILGLYRGLIASFLFDSVFNKIDVCETNSVTVY
jgi:hypothetical protein